MARKKRRFNKKRNTPKHIFILLTTIAFITVVLLEYIDYKNGKKSFIFTKLISLQKIPSKIDQFNINFQRVLNKNNIDCDYFQDEEKKYHFKLEIDAPRFKGLISKLESIAEQLKVKVKLSEIQGMADKSIMLYKIIMGEKISHLILITKLKKHKKLAQKIEPKEAKKPSRKTAKSVRYGKPKIAFIIDDIGNSNIGALRLKKLNIPVTASILPNSPGAIEEARWIRQYGLQALLHIPMQPKNNNGAPYNRNHTITMHSSDAEIRGIIRKAKQVVPNALGINNHQGSLVTSNIELMTRILKIIKEEELFFIDSRTTVSTVGYDIAKRLGLKTAYRDVFLDGGEKSYSKAVGWIGRLVEIARQKGKAIAIGHPNETTLRAIRDSIKFIRSKGIEIVYVSELLE